MPTIVITGAANTGKTELANRLNGTIYDSDRIRIPQHGGQLPDRTHPVNPEWAAAFDSEDGGTMVDDTGQTLTPVQLAALGGPWTYSAVRTVNYILHHLDQAQEQDLTVVTGQFQLDKGYNRDLLLAISARPNSFWFHLEAPLDICESRHGGSGKSYPVEWLGKYRKNNRTLAEWRADPGFPVDAFAQITQFVLDGGLDVHHNVALIRVKLNECVRVPVPLRMSRGPDRMGRIDPAPRSNACLRSACLRSACLRSASMPNPLPKDGGKTEPLVERCTPQPAPDGPPFQIFPIDTILTGPAALASLRADVQDMNTTRTVLDTRYTHAAQADLSELTRTGWSVKPGLNQALYAALATEYQAGNPFLRACTAHISDFCALMAASAAPPLAIRLPRSAFPPAPVIVAMARLGLFNVYDLPIGFLCRLDEGYDGYTLVTSIPHAYSAFRALLETMIQTVLTLYQLSNDRTPLQLLLSHQSVPDIPYGKAGSLEQLHFDNIETPWDHGVAGVDTKQYPTVLAVFEADAEGHYINMDAAVLNRESMGTEIYSYDAPASADLLAAAAAVDVAREFAPAEAAGILRSYVPENLHLHKGGNGNIMLFNHLHKAVKNNNGNKAPVTRSQWRLMAVQRLVDGAYGYEKQSENIGLNELLKERGLGPLNSQTRSGCIPRYSHRDRQAGAVVVRNRQTDVQEFGWAEAVRRGLVKTNY
jgi:hypothetical protein